MILYPSDETKQKLAELIKQAGFDPTGMSFTPRYMCDCCQGVPDALANVEHEAFPYHVKDKEGKVWEHLCNDCFDNLGIEINYEEDGDENGY